MIVFPDTVYSAVNLLDSWIAGEPMVSLWLVIGAILLFGGTLLQSRRVNGNIWGHDLLVSLAKALVYAFLLVMCFFLLNSSFNVFNHIFGPFVVDGSVSNLGWQEARNLYGGTYDQKDLQVTQYVTVDFQETIQSSDPSAPLLYRNVQVEQVVNQNSIARFRGDIAIHVDGAQGNMDTFNGYMLSAVYKYDIVNLSSAPTRAEFRFPISAESKQYEDVKITKNGEEIDWQINDGAIYWEDQMEAGEKNAISICFKTRGLNSFIFEIPEPREILNFDLKVTLDTYRYIPVTEPENGGVKAEFINSGANRILVWKIDQAILSPRLGFDLRQGWPFSPYQGMIVTMPHAARAAIFFLTLAMLTLLICSIDVRLPQLALLAGLFMIPFLVLMSGGTLYPGSISPAQYATYKINILPVVTIPILVLACFVLRKTPRLPLMLIVVLLAIFAGCYPTIGLLDEQKRNAMETFVQAGMIAYIFGLTLFVRLRKKG